MRQLSSRAFALIFLPLVLSGCAALHSPGSHEHRCGDEIVAAGQFFHTGTKVVLWMDPGGYDAYRVERRFSPIAEANWDDSRLKMGQHAKPNRYGMRDKYLTDAELERV